MKTTITITLDNGVLNYVANCDATGAIAILEAVKHKLVSQSLGGVGSSNVGASTPVGGGSRAPGLSVRRVDSRDPVVGS